MLKLVPKSAPVIDDSSAPHEILAFLVERAEKLREAKNFRLPKTETMRPMTLMDVLMCLCGDEFSEDRYDEELMVLVEELVLSTLTPPAFSHWPEITRSEIRERVGDRRRGMPFGVENILWKGDDNELSLREELIASYHRAWIEEAQASSAA